MEGWSHLIGLVLGVWVFHTLLPRWVGNPFKVIGRIGKLSGRVLKKGAKPLGRGLWYLAYRRQADRRGPGWGWLRVFLLWNLALTGAVLYAAPHDRMAFDGLILWYWAWLIAFFLYFCSIRLKRARSPRRRLPARRPH